MTDRRGFLGQLAGVLCGAAVGPVVIKATELPPAAALAIAPSAAPVTPALVNRLVLTNEAIANEALRLLRRNLAFVRARNVGHIGHNRWRVGDTISATAGLLKSGWTNRLMSGRIQQSAIDLSWTPRELKEMSLAEYSRARLEPAMEALAAHVAKSVIGSRELLCVGQSIPSDVDGVLANADDFGIRLVHAYDFMRREHVTRIDLAYGGVRE